MNDVEGPYELPEGWEWTRLGDIAEKINPGFPSGKHNQEKIGIPHLRPMNITINGDTSLSEVKYVQKTDYEPLLMGDVLFNNTNSPVLLGKTTCIKKDTDWAYSNHMTRIRLNQDFLIPDWIARHLHYLFLTGYFKINCTNHVNQASINTGYLSKNVSIPLPPLPEQRRIVARIEELFTHLDAGVSALKKAQAQLKRYRQSVLKAAVGGRLTEDWRREHPDVELASELLERILEERRAKWEENELAKMAAKGKRPENDRWKQKYKEPQAPETDGLPELPVGWVWATPDQLAATEKYSLAIGPFGSNLKVSDYRENGVPLVFVRNIRSGIFDGAGTHYVTMEKAEELHAHKIIGGDVLITKMGEPPGDACLYPDSRPTAIITADCIKWTLSNILPERRFFVHVINSHIMKHQILRITQGVAQKKVSLARFKGVVVPLPPLAEQHEIVSEIEHLLTVADNTEAASATNLKRAARFRQSILKKAFRGELVPQDPDDEPASALLEKIRAERAKTQPKKRRGRPRKKTPTQTELI